MKLESNESGKEYEQEQRKIKASATKGAKHITQQQRKEILSLVVATQGQNLQSDPVAELGNIKIADTSEKTTDYCQ